MSEEKYVVISEYKQDSALVHETYLDKASYEEAHARMRAISNNPQVIRVAMARLIYVDGHKGLIPPEPESLLQKDINPYINTEKKS